jgi:nicotinamide riboside kinase
MTTLIQFIGPQCTGKTTLAAGLFYTMKKEGLVVELIQEPARRRVYAGLSLEGAGQLSIITELYEHITDVVRAGVPWVVVDTHILVGMLYTKDVVVYNLCQSLHQSLRDMILDCITIVPVGDKPVFSSEGRAYAEGEVLPGHDLEEVLLYATNCIRIPHTIEPTDLYQRLLHPIEQVSGMLIYL